MKFLPFLLISFVLNLVFNGLDAFNDDLAQLLHDAQKEVEVQAGKVSSLERSFHVFKGLEKSHYSQVVKVNQLRSSVYRAGRSYAIGAAKAQQVLHDVKVNVESQTKRVVSIEEKLNNASKAPLEKAPEAEKLLHRVESVGDSMAKKIAEAEDLLYKEDLETKKQYSQQLDTADKLLLNSFEECRAHTKEVLVAEDLLGDVKKADKSLAEKLTTAEIFLSVNPEERPAKQVENVHQLLHDVKDEIKSQAKNIAKAEKLFHDTTQRIEAHADKVVKAKEVLQDAKLEHESQAKKVAKAVKLLHGARDEAKLQAEIIEKAEKLLGGGENWFVPPKETSKKEAE